MKCYNCNKFGHSADECHNKSGQKKQDDEANLAQDEDLDPEPMAEPTDVIVTHSFKVF